MGVLKMRRVIVLLIIGFCCLGIVLLFNTSIDLKTLSGQILLQNFSSAEQGLIMFKPSTKEISSIGAYASNARYMGSTSTVLLETGTGKIELFDIKTRETELLYQSNDNTSSISCITYVCKDTISLAEQDKLILINLQDNSKKIVVEDIGNGIHSWSSNAQRVYYSNKNNQIFELNIETGQKEYLANGTCPKVSQDNNLIAYFSSDRTKLVIKELNGTQYWEYVAPMINFCFSPNSQYLATIEHSRNFDFPMGYVVKIIDYTKNRAKTIISKYPGRGFDIDWME